MTKCILAAAFCVALGAAPVAHAGPRPLDEAEMAAVGGGLFDLYIVMPVVRIDNRNNARSVANGSSGVTSNAVSTINVQNTIGLPAAAAAPATPAAASAAASATGAANAVVPARRQPPVWVPWARELRPFWLVRGLFAPGGE